MKPAAVLFDFDGVIADSISVHLKAWDLAMAEMFNETMTESQRSEIIGMSTSEISALLADRIGSPHRADDLGALKRNLLTPLRNQVPLLPGVREAFDYLRSFQIPFGIASNATDEFIRSVLERSSIAIEPIIGIEKSGRPKPFPDVFLLCAKVLGVPFSQHSQCLVFEDSSHGLKAANAAGMFPIGVASQHSPDYLKKSGARATCKSLKEAVEFGWLSSLPLI